MSIPAYDAREHIVKALEADLVGPFDDSAREELLPLPPSRWYLTGFLAPEEGRENTTPTDKDELAAGSDVNDEERPGAGAETDPKRRQLFPASVGLSVMLPPGSKDDRIQVHVGYADYVRDAAADRGPPEHDDSGTEPPTDGKRHREYVWRRVPRGVKVVSLGLDPELLAEGVEVPSSEGLWLVGTLGTVDVPGVTEAGARALTVFLVNRRPPRTGPTQDEGFVFQVRLELHAKSGFVPRPDCRHALLDDLPANDSHKADREERDDRDMADLQFRHHVSFAVGHNIAVEPPPKGSGLVGAAPVTVVRSTWVPRYEVPRVVTREAPQGLETRMEVLGDLRDPDDLVRALSPLPEAYDAWLAAWEQVSLPGDSRQRSRQRLLGEARRAADRIRDGIDLLRSDATAREAFCLANAAMAMAARQRNAERYKDGAVPSWRLFQLGFMLLSLRGIADETHHDRRIADLIFFPTGGGKTEAYLGVIAFTLLLRRLRGQGRPDAGLGVAVLLRYTLRLLTLDQLGRAATLMCALEKLRWPRTDTLGSERFAVGLWIGASATANTLADAAQRIDDYKRSSSSDAPSPCPLTDCPWCGAPLDKQSMTLKPSRQSPTEVELSCVNGRSCEFNVNRNREGLPVVFVDDQIYRELPAFLVATVDKFAMLPWRGEAGMLFGRAHARMGRQFFGPMCPPPKKGALRLPDGLQPPELIVQDELHLIAGPLGTLCGLYESAIDALCTRHIDKPDDKSLHDGPFAIRPKVLASTATVRRARRQIRTLFARADTAIFPPHGIDDSETYFGKVEHDEPGRLYLGVAASGRAMKAVLLRTYIILLGAAYRHLDADAARDEEQEHHAEAYSTLVGYFNSLRELGGMRRLVEDEVRLRCSDLEKRRPIGAGEPAPHPWYRNRLLQLEPIELTSRESTARIKEAKSRLDAPWHGKEPHRHVDVALASNMISVGVDIDRLGLMVIAGQPKTTAEYIQASSRVGRNANRPGLVVTCFNLFRPRDRSHYERFAAYHQSFYRFVEATSATPYSGPALDRGFAGTLVAMVRHLGTELTHPDSMSRLSELRAYAEEALDRLAKRGAKVTSPAEESDREHEEAWNELLRARGRQLLDAWEGIVERAAEAAGSCKYASFEKYGHGRPLLHMALDEDLTALSEAEAKFIAPTSMRDVEPESPLWLKRELLGERS